MTRKLKILAATVMAAVIGVTYQSYAVSKNQVKSNVSIQFQRLLQEHQKFVQTAYSAGESQKTKAVYTPAAYSFEKNFFLYTGFLQDSHIQNFFHNVEADISRSGKPGYTMMSYTSISLVNGQSRSIQYTYQSNGKDITLVKQTNDNGNLLKSVYYYDIESQSLKAGDYRENNIIHEKVYKI